MPQDPTDVPAIDDWGRLLAGRPLTEVEGNIRMLAAFALVAVAVGAVLFRFVVEE